MSSALVPVTVNGEVLYRLAVIREAIAPLQVETLGTHSSSPSGGPLALVYGRAWNVGVWNEIHQPAEAKFMGLSGDRFMEKVAPHAFDRAIDAAESGRHRPPVLLWQHGSESEGKRPLGKITRLHSNGAYEALLYDLEATRELLPAMKGGQLGTSYAPSGTIRGELRRRPPRSEHNPEALAEWRLQGIEQLREISVVLWPADSAATIAVKDVKRPQLVS